MTWAARLAKASAEKSTDADSVDSVDSPSKPPIGTIGTIDKGRFTEKSSANDDTITVPCARCGTRSRPFVAIANPENWMCDACWPAWPDDAAYEQEECAAIMSGAAPVVVLHQMPPSWSDATIEPTAGARCRCCSGSKWWTEATSPKGWRCTTCYGSDHLAADAVREVRT